MDKIPVQFWNALVPMDCTPLPIIMVSIPLQPQKEPLLTVFILPSITNVPVSPLQFWKAYSPMVETASGMTNSPVRLLQYLKADAPIF